MLPLLQSGQIYIDFYHKELHNIGQQYRKFDITTLQYQTLISYLTLNYTDEIEEIINNISYLNENTIDELFNPYQDELPIDRLNMAKAIVLQRAKWITNFYYKNRTEGRGKIL